MLHFKTPGIRIVLFVLILFPFYCFAQQPAPEAALERFAKYPPERIYVQFDKDEYVAGETVHYKAWVFVRSSLSYVSTNLYADWMDDQKNIINSMVIPLVGGVCEGSFVIPADMEEHIYYFRAYTGWMLNFNESLQLVQPVIIYNPASKMRLKAPAASWTASLQPEGGSLVDGVETDVSVRLRSYTKLQGRWSGSLYDNSDTSNSISDFKSLNEEVGIFTITPYYGKQYSVKITGADGSSSTFPLPAVQKQGVALKIAADDLGISFRISSRGLSNPLKGYKIVAHKQGEIVYSATIQNSKEDINGLIPLDASTRGLLDIIVFDAGGNAVAERVYFANLQQCSFITPVVDYGKLNSAAKAANEWKIAIDTIRANSYLALVEDAHTGLLAQTNSMLGCYWLNGIATLPQNASWYFMPGNKAAAGALDALLAGEKWRACTHDDIFKKTQAVTYMPDNFISYTGMVTQKGRPVSNEKITLLFQLKDSSRILTEVKTDSAGAFSLKSLYFFDTAKVFYHITNNKNAPVKIDVAFKRTLQSAPYNGTLPATGFALVARTKSDTMPQRMKEYIMAQKHIQTIADGYKTMDAVVVKATIRSKTDALDRRLSSPMFRSPGETVFDFVNEEQDLGGSTVLEWLGGRVAGVMPDGSGGVTIRNQRPAIYIDEFLDDGDPSRLASIPYTEIAMVKVIRNSYLIGASGAPVIAVYTKRPDMFPKEDLNRPHVTAKSLPGYVAADIFKPLSYGKSMTFRAGYDTRTLLYWNSTITPENDNALLRFYNNDISGKLHMLVVGFTSKGKLVYLDKDVVLK